MCNFVTFTKQIAFSIGNFCMLKKQIDFSERFYKADRLFGTLRKQIDFTMRTFGTFKKEVNVFMIYLDTLKNRPNVDEARA